MDQGRNKQLKMEVVFQYGLTRGLLTLSKIWFRYNGVILFFHYPLALPPNIMIEVSPHGKF